MAASEMKVLLHTRMTWRFRALDRLADLLTKARMHRTAGWLILTVLTRVPVCYVRGDLVGSKKKFMDWTPVYANIKTGPEASPEPNLGASEDKQASE